MAAMFMRAERLHCLLAGRLKTRGGNTGHGHETISRRIATWALVEGRIFLSERECLWLRND
jgi:hypothetical protein